MARRRGRTFESEPTEEPLPRTGLEGALAKRAGERSFKAGREYFRQGNVLEWEQDGRELKGAVAGSETYEVELLLTIDARDIAEYGCDCPYHEDHGAFCKHCVALGLAFAARKPTTDAAPKPKKPASTKETLRTYLENLEKPALIALVLRLADDDRELRQKLNLEAASAGPREAHAAALRSVISSTLYTRGFLEYGEDRAWARRAQGVLSQFQPLLSTDPALAIELCELAIEKLERVQAHADDSDGYIGDLKSEVEALHLEACRVARPDPIALAKRLCAWELRDDWDTFFGAAKTYADVLGEAGRAEYRRLLRAEWEKFPPLKPGEREYGGRRFRVKHALEALLEAEDDTEALIALRSKDLTHPFDYLRVAQTALEAGQGDAALDWAERGWKAFEQRDSRLAAFLIARYRQRQRHDDAIEVAWTLFEFQPSADHAGQVKALSEPTGRWTALRDTVLARLSPDAAPPKHRMFWHPQRTDELVKFLLKDSDYEAAWSAAQAHHCSDALWLELAERRPGDAVGVWKRLVETWTEAGNSRYSEPVALLAKVAARLPEEEFIDYVTALRARFKRKRNFLAELERRGW